MMNEENNIDKLFREKLGGISEDPPAFVWDGIKEKLVDGRKKKRAAWYSWSAVAALLALAFIAGWYFNESSEKTTPQTAETEVVKSPAEENSENTNKPAEPEQAEDSSGNEERNVEFLADAAGIEPAAKKTAAADSKTSGQEPVEVDSMEKLTPPEKIKPVEADLYANDQSLVEDVALLTEKTSGISPYEKEIIERNVAAYREPSLEESGWRMGVNVSPGYSSYAAKYGNEYASNMTREAGDGNANMSGGIALRYRTSKRWSVESGIYYAQNGKQAGSLPQVYGGRAEADYSAAPERLYFNTAVKMENNSMAMNSIAGVIEIENLPAGAEIAANLENYTLYDNSLVTQGELSQVFDLIEIPLYLRYLLVESKLDVELMGGINAGVIVGNRAFLDNQFGVQRIGRTRDISTTNISGTIGLGFSYALNKHFSLGLEPRLNYYMNSISRNPDVEFRPYRIGVYTGLYYAF